MTINNKKRVEFYNLKLGNEDMKTNKEKTEVLVFCRSRNSVRIQIDETQLKLFLGQRP